MNNNDNIIQKLLDVGVKDTEIPGLLKSLGNTQKKFTSKGFNITLDTVVARFATTFKKHVSTSGAEKARKLAFNDLYNTKFSPIKKTKKVGRNSQCPCGSGKKYKGCCLNSV